MQMVKNMARESSCTSWIEILMYRAIKGDKSHEMVELISFMVGKEKYNKIKHKTT